MALALALVHYDEKPSGVSVLGGAAPTSVWDMSRAQVLARWLHPGETKVVATLERQATKGQTIGLIIGREDVSYPYSVNGSIDESPFARCSIPIGS